MLKALGKDIAIYGAGEFVFKFIAFAVFPIYAHVLSVEAFGTWALLSVCATLLGFIVNLGVNQAVQRYYFDAGTGRADEPRIVSTAFVQLLIAAVVIVGAALLAAEAAGEALARHGIDRLLIVLALATVIPDQLLQLCLDTLRLHFTPLRFLALSFAKNIVGTALALWWVVGEGAGLHGLFSGLLVGSVAALPLGFWLIRRDLVLAWDSGIARALFAFGFPLTFTSIAHWIYTSMDRWLLAEIGTAQELGLYSAAAKFATIVTFLIAAFGQAWLPFAIRLSRDDPDHQAVYGRIFALWYFLLAIVALTMALYSREALVLLTPPAFWPAASTLPLLAAGMALFGTTQITSLGITIEKRTILSTWATWIAAAANFGLNLLLIPHFGAIGSAAATFLSYAVLTGFLLFWTQRLHPIPLHTAGLVYCTALVLLAASLSAVDLGELGARGFFLKAAVLLVALAGAFAVGILDRSVFRLVRLKGAC